MIELSDEDLLLRRRNFEDAFVERKVSSDSKDWLKTAVAFANSTPVGYPAVLYIGVKHDGTPEDKAVNLDSLQKTFSEKVSIAYPPIFYFCKVLVVDAKQILAVIIPGSEQRPHFAGKSYVRRGSESVEASEEQFTELVASRDSKVYEILKWKGKGIALAFVGKGQSRPTSSGEVAVVGCNPFYVTLQAGSAIFNLPLQRIEVSFDSRSNRLQLEEHTIP